MSGPPEILAIDDDLARLESAVDGDPAVAIDGARSRLTEFEVREAAAQESLLEDVENLLLRAEEQVEGDRARRLEGIRNRIRIYRDTVSRSDEDLAVIDSTLRSETEAEADVSALRGEAVEIVATVVNAGSDRDAVVAVGFFDADGEEVDEVVSEPVALSRNEQAPIELETIVPDGTAYYAVSALDAGSATIG